MAEDERLIDMVRCGLASDFWKAIIPDRTFGDVANRRLELIEAGVIVRARAI